MHTSGVVSPAKVSAETIYLHFEESLRKVC